MLKALIVLLILQAVSPAEVRSERFRNRDAWTLDTPKLRVTILKSGGHIAEIVLVKANSVNPLWIQSRPTIDDEQYIRAKHEKFYGGGFAARLLAGLLGHNVCFPFWGGPSASEGAAGMTFHGETGIVRWKQTASGPDFVTVHADLPESGTSFTRTIRISGQVVSFEETARNGKAWDRPVGWCEHVTIGPPFLERGVTQIQASLTRGRDAKTEFAWPDGMAEVKVDLRKVRNLPTSPGFVNNFLVDPQRDLAYLAVYHPKYRLVFGYVFPRAQFPWLNIWESNTADMLTRGLEFSNTPVHGTLKALMQTPQIWGIPTYEWLNARSEIKKRFWAFSVHVPDGFQGVGDVLMRDRKIQVVEQGTSRLVAVPDR